MESVQNLAQENLTLLQAHHRGVAKELLGHLQEQRLQKKPNPYQIVASSSGKPTLVRIADGKRFFCHDSHQPQDDSQQISQTISKEFSGSIVIYSSGLGYVPYALASTFGRCRILIVEPEYDVLFHSMQVTDWRSILPSKNLLLLAGPKSVDEAEDILQRHGSLMKDGVRVISGRTLHESEKESFDRIERICMQSKERFLSVKDEKKDIDPTRVGLAVSNVHLDILHTLCGESRAVGKNDTRIFQRDVLATFSKGDLPVWETAGIPLPQSVLAFSWNVFHRKEWESFGEYGVRRKLWFFDDPFRFELDEKTLERIDDVYCFDPVLSQKLRDRFAREIIYMPSATTFSEGVQGTPPQDTFSQIDAVFIGSTGLHRFNEQFVKWISQNPPALQVLRERVRERLQNGCPFEYDEIFKLDFPISGLSPVARVSLVEDLVTFWIRCEYLSALPKDRLRIFGDPGWSKNELVGALTRSFAGRSLDLFHETPWVFQQAKININIFNVQCVNSPIVRLFDVMACGGFLLTERRPFIESTFEIGKELDTFRTPFELNEKVEYYLNRPDLRKEIALAGQRRIVKEHRYRDRFRRMFPFDK